MLTAQTLQDIKKLVIYKIQLIQKKDEWRTIVANGKDFFYKHAYEENSKLFGAGAQRMLEVISEIEKIDTEIKGIDTLIITHLEMAINDVNFKFTIPQHPNDAGDIIPSTDVILGQENTALNVDDLWTIILLKEMFDVNNVEIIKR